MLKLYKPTEKTLLRKQIVFELQVHHRNNKNVNQSGNHYNECQHIYRNSVYKIKLCGRDIRVEQLPSLYLKICRHLYYFVKILIVNYGNKTIVCDPELDSYYFNYMLKMT